VVLSSNADQPPTATCEDGAMPPECPKFGILVVSMPFLLVKDFVASDSCAYAVAGIVANGGDNT
jgi:hypothetical protein